MRLQEIATLRHADDPLEELARRFGKHGLPIFIASKEDDLANATAWPWIEVETDMIARTIMGQRYPPRIDGGRVVA